MIWLVLPDQFLPGPDGPAIVDQAQDVNDHTPQNDHPPDGPLRGQSITEGFQSAADEWQVGESIGPERDQDESQEEGKQRPD